MKRPDTLKALLLAGVFLLSACQDSEQADANLNLVVICIDTVRYDSFLDDSISDELNPWLERAQWYENATAAGPWTMPSVSSLFTGLYPIEHSAGRFENEVANFDVDLPNPLGPEAVTLAEHMQEAQIRTGAFVSHPFFRPELGLRQGFDKVEFNREWSEDVEQFWDWLGSAEPHERFFGYLHFMEAHDRHKAGNADLIKTLESLDPDTRRLVRDLSTPQACEKENHRRCLQNQVYNLAVLEMRSAVASVLAGLEQKGLAENTLVILYSDHGEEFWDHRAEQQLLAEDPRGGAGFGHGQSMYQELLHIPLMAWHPELEGRRHQQVVSHVDVLPSILDALGLQRSSETESGELLPVTGSGSSGLEAERIIFSSGMAYGPEKISVRSGELKSVFTIRDDRYELYNLQSDPQERSPARDENLVMMFDTLTGDYLEMKNVSDYASSSFDSKQIEELKAIGYLQGVETEEGEADDKESTEQEGQP